MSMAAQEQGRSEQRKVQRAESERQSSYQDEARKEFAVSEQGAGLDSQANQLMREQGERAGAYEKATTGAQALPVLPTSSTSMDGNKVIGGEMADALSRAKRYNTQQGNAQSRLAGYGDLNLNNAIQNSRQMQKMNLIGNLSQGSARVLPYELQSASHKGDNLMQLGQLVSALGMVTGAAGAAGAFSGAGASAGAGAGGVGQAANTVGGAGTMASSSPFLTSGASIGRAPTSSLFTLPMGF
jgi:hypothetical protein